MRMFCCSPSSLGGARSQPGSAEERIQRRRPERFSDGGNTVLMQPTFTALYREHAATVFDAVHRFGVHPRNAEDVVQDVFFAVFKALDRYDPARPFKPWLKTITYRTARDHLELGRTRESL